jgi:hypothetical protein
VKLLELARLGQGDLPGGGRGDEALTLDEEHAAFVDLLVADAVEFGGQGLADAVA